MNKNQVRPVSLDIAGQKLNLRTDASDHALRELSELVNERIESIHKSAPNTPLTRVYLLAALTFADELQREREGQASLKRDLLALVEQTITELDGGEAVPAE